MLSRSTSQRQQYEGVCHFLGRIGHEPGININMTYQFIVSKRRDNIFGLITVGRRGPI